MGGQPERVDPAGADIRERLTPHQWRVATVVVRGLTGRSVDASPGLGARAAEVLLSRTFAGWADRSRVEAGRGSRFTNA